jgi:hypothetical protein
MESGRNSSQIDALRLPRIPRSVLHNHRNGGDSSLSSCSALLFSGQIRHDLGSVVRVSALGHCCGYKSKPDWRFVQFSQLSSECGVCKHGIEGGERTVAPVNMAEDMQPRMLSYHGITKLRTTAVEVLAWRAVENFEWRPMRDKDVQPGRHQFPVLHSGFCRWYSERCIGIGRGRRAPNLEAAEFDCGIDEQVGVGDGPLMFLAAPRAGRDCQG